MSKRPFKWIIHPVLFSAYPVLFVFCHNIAETPVSHIFLPISITVGMGLLIWGLAGLLFRSSVKGALAASLSMMMLLLYKRAYVVFEDLSGWSPRHRYVLLAWMILLATGVVVIKFARPAVAAVLSRIANALAVILIIVACVPLVTYFMGGQSSTQEVVGDDALKRSLAGWSRASGQHPDIYYIVLDGYGRADMLKKHYDFDNSDFLDGLKSRGFFVADKSTSNYCSTRTSLSTSLNMDYHPSLTYLPTDRSIQLNTVTRLLRLIGYKHVFVPSGYPITDDSPIADVMIDVGTSTRTELSAFVLEWSALWFLFDSDRIMAQEQTDAIHGEWGGLDLDGRTAWHQHITRSIEAIGDRAKTPGPQYIFAHIVCPHPPYIFNRDGSLNDNSAMTDLSHGLWGTRQYVDQMVHLNSLLEAMIETILANSKRPPIIILQSDHGTLASDNAESDSAKEDLSRDVVRERMANLFACYAPKTVRDRLYHSITPVNIFRIIFNEQFGARYDLLKDRNFWTYVKPHRDVTAIATD